MDGDQQELLSHIPVEEEPKKPEAVSSDQYVMRTSPEMDALQRAAADGQNGRHYQNIEQGYVRVHQAPGHTHHVELLLRDEEVHAGKTVTVLEELTRRVDADAVFVLLYISQLLAPPPAAVGVGNPAPGNAAVDLDDVIAKIGWDPRSTEDRQEMRRKIWGYIEFFEQARVKGMRKGKYYDTLAKVEIDTEIQGPVWRVLHEERATLLKEFDVPLRVELGMSSEWKALLSSPFLAQYLPFGQLVGAIPGQKTTGAWARVIGLALANFWRRNPRETKEGQRFPQRRELLETYVPKTGSVLEILGSRNPGRALEYWQGALKELVEVGFLANEGEAALTIAELRDALPSYKWQAVWIDGTAELVPGEVIRPVIEHVAGLSRSPRALVNKKAS